MKEQRRWTTLPTKRKEKKKDKNPPSFRESIWVCDCLMKLIIKGLRDASKTKMANYVEVRVKISPSECGKMDKGD